MSSINQEGLSKAYRFLADHYFRAETIVPSGFSLSSGRPVIFVANHSGMAFSWDAHILREELARRFGADLRLRRLVSPLFFRHRLIQQFGIPGFAPLDSVPATRHEFEKALQDGHNVLIFPEGIAGIAKGFNNRYQLQNFSSSIVRMSLRYNADIVMVSVVNGEYLNPFAYANGVANWVARKLGLPFLALGLFTPSYILSPWSLYACMPAKLTFVLSRRIQPSTLSDKKPQELDDHAYKALTARLRSDMQKILNENVLVYGGKKYDWISLMNQIRSLGRKAVFLLPVSWPLFFQMAALPKGASRRTRWGRAWLAIVQTIPVLGWPLFLILLNSKIGKVDSVKPEAIGRRAA